jgi:spore maturation protein CgeB
VTTKPFELELYRTAGAREVMLIHQGHGRRLGPVPKEEIPLELRSEVCFIGHCQPSYAKVMQSLAARVPLTIWGPGWPEYAKDHQWARDVVRGSGVYGPDYARALSGAKIAVGLLSKRIPETTTTRSFEIPACGTMMLAERTNDHRALFQEGSEAEFFDGVDELCAKVETYLADDAARDALAAAGNSRCAADGYSFEAQFAPVFRWIERAVASPRTQGELL